MVASGGTQLLRTCLRQLLCRSEGRSWFCPLRSALSPAATVICADAFNPHPWPAAPPVCCLELLPRFPSNRPATPPNYTNTCPPSSIDAQSLACITHT